MGCTELFEPVSATPGLTLRSQSSAVYLQSVYDIIYIHIMIYILMSLCDVVVVTLTTRL
jgi:hypothetical protein